MEKLETFNLEHGSMKHFGILKQNILFQNREEKSALIAAGFAWTVVLFLFLLI